jgi:hypothetical protein
MAILTNLKVATKGGALLAIAVAAVAAVLGGCADRPADPIAAVAPVLVTEARDAGIMAIAGPVRGTVRVLYARNGSMVLLREIRLPVGTTIRELSLSADGGDLFIGTGAVGYAVSTRTGRIEAWALAER